MFELARVRIIQSNVYKNTRLIQENAFFQSAADQDSTRYTSDNEASDRWPNNFNFNFIEFGMEGTHLRSVPLVTMLQRLFPLRVKSSTIKSYRQLRGVSLPRYSASLSTCLWLGGFSSQLSLTKLESKGRKPIPFKVRRA